MRTLLFSIFLVSSIAAFSQNDHIYLHNGKTVDGTVVKVTEFTIVFKYENEDAEQTISRYAVQKIIYGKSGREESISEKIVINSKEDWANVVILEDKSLVAGMSKVSEIRGKTAFINYRTAAGSDKKSQDKLKQEAALLGCQFVLLTSDKDTDLNGSEGKTFGSTQSIKKGVAYKY